VRRFREWLRIDIPLPAFVQVYRSIVQGENIPDVSVNVVCNGNGWRSPNSGKIHTSPVEPAPFV
jgi:hypothetical protein